jgi:hypothetical protein
MVDGEHRFDSIVIPLAIIVILFLVLDAYYLKTDQILSFFGSFLSFSQRDF